MFIINCEVKKLKSLNSIYGIIDFLKKYIDKVIGRYRYEQNKDLKDYVS